MCGFLGKVKQEHLTCQALVDCHRQLITAMQIEEHRMRHGLGEGYTSLSTTGVPCEAYTQSENFCTSEQHLSQELAIQWRET